MENKCLPADLLGLYKTCNLTMAEVILDGGTRTHLADIFCEQILENKKERTLL